MAVSAGGEDAITSSGEAEGGVARAIDDAEELSEDGGTRGPRPESE